MTILTQAEDDESDDYVLANAVEIDSDEEAEIKAGSKRGAQDDHSAKKAKVAELPAAVCEHTVFFSPHLIFFQTNAAKGAIRSEQPKKEQPKVEAKKEQPKPEPKKEQPKPEAKKDQPKPEAKKDQPKPEAKKEQPKPEAKKEQPKPEAKKEQPKPEAKKEEPKPVKHENMLLSGNVVAKDLVVGTGKTAKRGQWSLGDRSFSHGTGNRVQMYYVGILESNKKQFDKCLSGKPFEFRLGAQEVIKGDAMLMLLLSLTTHIGWDVGIEGMREGGKRLLTIPAGMVWTCVFVCVRLSVCRRMASAAPHRLSPEMPSSCSLSSCSKSSSRVFLSIRRDRVVFG
jgi:FK506-binding nuclear protein